MITRRDFLKYTAIAGMAAAMPMGLGVKKAHAVANSPGLAKWVQNIRKFGTDIPFVSAAADPTFPGVATNFYKVTAAQFTDQLHPGLQPTTLWGYWDSTSAVPQKHLGGVIVATRGTATRLRVKNTLPPNHIIPVDTSIPGANQAQNRIAVHLHGGYIPWISDGGPFDWYTPSGASGLSFQNGPGSVLDNVLGQPMVAGEADYFYPNDQSTRLMWYHDHAHGITRINAYAGIATGYLLLDSAQNAKLLNSPPAVPTPLVFQDKVFVNGATIQATDPTWVSVMQAQGQTAAFATTTGTLWYEHVYDPRVFRLATGRQFIRPVPNPSAIPEFFGDTMLCNGTVYPLLTVPAGPTRLVLLNACNARFLNINLLQADGSTDGITLNARTLFPVNPAGPNMTQIANEAGYLVKDVTYTGAVPFNPALFTGQLLLAPAERADIIIDFSAVTVTTDYILYNDAPGPFPAGPPTTDYFLGNPKNPIQPVPGFGPDTRQILRIRVTPAAATAQVLPILPGAAILDPPLLADINLAAIPANATATTPYPAALTPNAGVVVAQTRNLSLNEDFDQFGRLRQLLGLTVVVPGITVPGGFGIEYLAPATETPIGGTTEIWNVFNNTADTHPIHFHLVNAQILSRQPFRFRNGRFTPTGVPVGPQPNEFGWKETVQMHPGQVTSCIMKFDLPPVPFVVPPSQRTGGNEYVWHCHILEHEEHDMMRPIVVSNGPLAIAPAVITCNVPCFGPTFAVTGGVQPYTATVTDPLADAVVTVNGNFVTVNSTVGPFLVPRTVNLQVADAAGIAVSAVLELI